MTITPTIGSPDSDTYKTVSEFHQYVQDMYGVDLSGNDLAKDEADLRTAAMLLDAQWLWRGRLASETQQRAFPRIFYSKINGRTISSTEIPRSISNAQAELAYLLHQGVDLSPTNSGGSIKSESLGAGSAKISTQYSEFFSVPQITRAEIILAPFSKGRVPTSFSASASLVRG